MLQQPETKIERILASNPQVFIRQQFNSLQAIIGWHQQNQYWVHKGEYREGQEYPTPLFSLQELSECSQRHCLISGCRGFKMHASMYPQDGQIQMEIQKECTCTFFCYDRPVIKVKIMGQMIGSIISQFLCCQKGFNVHDADGQLLYTIKASCCQPANLCQCPCGSCQILNFDIRDNSGQFAGSLVKTSIGCLRSYLTNTDNFLINFPPESTARDRCLLIAGTILTDYTYFEERRI